jgi:DNA mismatch repair protein MutH
MSFGVPQTLDELRVRAASLEGRLVRELEGAFEAAADGPMVQRKGKLGQLIERILGASAGSAAIPDFPRLGVELKTIPLDAEGKPRETTFVCSLSLSEADSAEWETSSVRAKLDHVLWVPVIVEGERSRIGRPWFWHPTPAQEAVLRADFDDIMGMIAIGKVEDLTAHVGRWLQARPKAAHSRVRTRAYGAEDEPITALPRGFYLRTRFTHALQSNPETLTGAALV